MVGLASTFCFRSITQQSFEIIIYYFFVELVLNKTVPLSYNRNLELPY